MKVTTALGAALLAGIAPTSPTMASPMIAGTQQAAPPLDAPSITVRGNPDRKADLDRLTRSISQQHEGQLARFEDTVCISAGGMIEPYNGIFARRMEQDATDAGIKVGKPGCHPNIIVILSDHVRTDLEKLSRQRDLVTSIGAQDKDVKLLVQSPGPAYLLTMTETRTGDGTPPQPGVLLQRDAPQYIIHDSSIINPLTRQDIVAVLMVIDSKATLGKTLSQIADYAALRTLAHLKDMPPETPEPTILTLFREGAAPNGPALNGPVLNGLSTYDRAYLKGLYGGPATMTAETRMHEIVNVAMHPDKRQADKR